MPTKSKTQNKTQATRKSVSDFVNKIKDPEQKKETKELLKIFKDITKKKAVMWGPTIIGFGKYHYARRDGSEHDFLATGFSPRKGSFSLYIMTGFDKHKDLMKKLGKYKTGVGCLYIKKLEDVHLPTLKQLIRKGFKEMDGKDRVY